jgi:hypothetical protein
LLKVVLQMSLSSREAAMHKTFLIARPAFAFEMANAMVSNLPNLESPEPRSNVAL